MVKSRGVRLKKIVNFQEGGNYPIMYAMGGMEKVSLDVAQVAPQIPVGENKITSSVTITYEVE